LEVRVFTVRGRRFSRSGLTPKKEGSARKLRWLAVLGREAVAEK
jgi:hypothetical protein